MMQWLWETQPWLQIELLILVHITYCSPPPSIVTDIGPMREPIWGHYGILDEALCEFFMLSVDVIVS